MKGTRLGLRTSDLTLDLCFSQALQLWTSFMWWEGLVFLSGCFRYSSRKDSVWPYLYQLDQQA